MKRTCAAGVVTAFSARGTESRNNPFPLTFVSRCVITAIGALVFAPAWAQGQTPQISSVTPTSAAVGVQVTITGSNFGTNPGSVAFNGTSATPASWSDSSITVQVPAGATSGNIVVTVGGLASNGAAFTVLNAGFTPTGTLTTARMFHTATLLNTGSVLVVGGVGGFTYNTIPSAELYNPATGTFSLTGNLNSGRIFNTATLLTDGTVLIVGGTDSNWNNIAAAELYYPASGNFRYVGALNDPRGSQTATLLSSGQVLITGGVDSNGDYITSLAAVGELYDPATQAFTSTGILNTARDCHTATLLNNGQVLIVGGLDVNGNVLASAEIYDPTSGTYTSTGSLNLARAVHTAALLNNGQVLIAGGYDSNGNAVASAELYDPIAGTFSVTGSMVTPRYDGPWPAALLGNGTVLIAGGQDTNGNTLATAEVFDPGTGTFSIGGTMSTTRQSLTTTLLSNGQVLAVGGMDFYANVLASAELYQPSTLTPTGLVSIALSPNNSVAAGTSQALTATGTFSDGSTQILASASWSSSDNAILTVSSDITNHGVAYAVAPGSATVSACAGSVCGSTAITVAPSITSLSPAFGALGTPVTITGAGFGSTQGSSTVSFNGTAATVTTWTATSIVAVAPAGATTGNVVITVNGVSSNGSEFVFLPTITSITPTTVSTGTQVTITGTGFDVAQNSGYVILNNAYGVVTSWSDRQIVAVVQPGTASGSLYVHQDGFDSNAVAFTSTFVASAPAIMNLSPSSGILGDQIIINGVNFGATQQTSSGVVIGVVTFNGATAYAASWSDNSIAAYVPYNATSGSVVVTVNGTPSNATPFTILTPSITSLSPNAGAVGATVTITGTGFGAIQGSGGVSFNNVTASVTSWGDTSIAAVVPSGASTGNVVVLRSGLYSSVSSNGVPFTVPQNAPAIASLSPNSGLPGTLIMISGSNFGASQGNSLLTFNGILAVPSAWTANSISVAVPVGATSGSVVVTANGTASNGVNFTVPTLASISVTPGNASIATGTTQQFAATGTYTDGSKQQLSTTTWSSSVTSVATINTTGAASAMTEGQTTIQATFSGVVGSTTLTVAPPIGSFVATGTLITPRSGHTATLLTNGQVLIAGGEDSTPKNTSSAELYNQTTGVFAATGSLNTARQGHSAVLLNNGMVLISGGQDIHGLPLASAELYDLGTGNFVSTGNLNIARQYASATLLANGKVLIVGGESSLGVLSSAEIYDSATGAFTTTGSLTTARVYHTATALNDGTVLIAGGQTSGTTALGTAEIYNPIAGTFTTLSGNLNDARNSHTATLLNNGKVLLAQGFDINSSVLGSAELYDPASQTFTYTASPNSPRNASSATLLSNGAVLLTAGYDANLMELLGAETYDPVAASFTTIGNVIAGRKFHTATLLNNENVLLAGGLDNNSNTLGSAELYQPPTTAPATLISIAVNPSSASVPVATAQRFTAVGTFSDSTTETLPSVNWSSSAANIATVTSDSTNAGAVFAASAGTATINACAGSICGSAAITVPSAQLTALTITPANPVLTAGASVPLLATATFSDGGVQDFTAFVTWSSSASNIASINSTTGMATGIAAGTTTITATYGGTNATTTLTVPPPLASIAITPTNPTLSIGGTQQFIATATYTDGSTSDVTNSVQWAVAAPQVANINATGTLTAASQGTDAVSASLGGISTSVSVTVVVITPTVSSVSPASGAIGTQVSVSGSGFGSAQGAGSVWLGTSPGTVVSWTDSQIIATVAPGSNSGNVQVSQNGVVSNSLTFTVNAAAISGTTPSAGPPGTQVTISGSGFGSAQGSGQVWLGTAVGQVVSWSDTQVVALVVAGSTSGAVQVLQNGVWSNSVPFTVTGGAPHITGITPTSGSAGTIVTIQGSGFGANEGDGAVLIGGAYGEVQGWSDSVVVASVAGNAVSGVVKVQQNGAWSNTLTFTIPGNFSSGGSSVTLVPNAVNMVVGDERTLQALAPDNQPVTGLSWTSSNTSVISLSTDDPPILTAVAPGNSTITAGNTSADVTVFTGPTLPLGTVIWSNPGDGSGVNYIVPAVPSPTGLADVFAMNNSGNLQAIQSDGTVGWTTNIASPGTQFPILLPDFQGGSIIFDSNSNWVYRVDGLTGQHYPAYTAPGSEQNFGGLGYPAIHTDGTIFTTENNCSLQDCTLVSGEDNSGATGSWVTAIDPATGVPKFKVSAQASTLNYTNTLNSIVCGPLGSSTNSFPTFPSNPIIAGDGYAYSSYYRSSGQSSVQLAPQNQDILPYNSPAYSLYNSLGNDITTANTAAALSDVAALQPYLQGIWAVYLSALQSDLQNGGLFSDVQFDYSRLAPPLTPLCNKSDSTTYEVHLLKVGTDGSSVDTVERTWQVTTSINYGRNGGSFSYTQTQSGQEPHVEGLDLITNADQGALMSWGVYFDGYCAQGTELGCTSYVSGSSELHLTNSASGDVIWPSAVPLQGGVVEPVLQLQDGTYIGQVSSSSGEYMVKFNASGQVLNITSGGASNAYYPQIATADGGVIASPGSVCNPSGCVPGPAPSFDSNLNLTGQIPILPTFSWKGAYQDGDVTSISSPLTDLAATFAAVPLGNLGTQSPTYVVHHTIGLFWCGNSLSGSCAGQVDFNQHPLANFGFYYGNGVMVPCIQKYLTAPPCSGTVDFTSARPDWDSIIISKAFDAARAAFAQFPAIVVEPVSTSPSTFNSIFGTKPNPISDQDSTVYIHAGFSQGSAGLTQNGESPSWIYYGTVLYGAIVTLNLNDQLPAIPIAGITLQKWESAWTRQQESTFKALLADVGREIGNTIAHEVGHQFSLPEMDCDRPASNNLPAKPCPGNSPHFNFYEYYQTAAPSYLDIGSPLLWTMDDITVLNSKLLKK